MARASAVAKPSEPAEQFVNVPVSEIVGLKDELTRILTHLHTGLLTLQNAAADSIRVAQMAPNRVLAGAGISVGNMGLTPLQPMGNAISNIAAPAIVPDLLVIDGKSKKQKREKKTKDPFAPARPVTAYFLFLKENRADIKAELGADAAPGQVQQKATEKWKDLPENEKEKYKVKYKENWTKYEKALEKYKAQGGQVPASVVPAALDAVVDPEAESDDSLIAAPPAAPASKKKETKKAGPKGAAGTPARGAGTPAKSPDLKKKKSAAATAEENKKKRKSTDTGPEKSKKKKKSEA